MITFTISETIITFLLYLLTFFSAINFIAAIYLIVLVTSENKKIMQILTRLACDVAANTSSEYRKGIWWNS